MADGIEGGTTTLLAGGSGAATAGATATGAAEGAGASESNGAGAKYYDGLPPDLLPTAEKHGTLEELVKAHISLRQKLSTGLQRPGKDAKPEQIADWRRQIGVPERPDDYKFDPPEGLKVDDKSLGEVRAKLHEIGLTPEQYAGVMGLWADRTKADMDAKAKAIADEANGTRAELVNEWGPGEFEGRLARAERIVEWLGIGEQLRGAGLTNNGAVIRALDKVAAAMGEDSIAETARPGAKANPADRLTDIERRMADPKLSNTSPEYQRLSAERMNLLGALVARGG